MNYTSTRNGKVSVSSATAIAKAISDDGGLFVPESIPALRGGDIDQLCAMKYPDRAAKILKCFLTDFTDDEIAKCVKGAYSGTFENNQPAPLYKLRDGVNILELWHGPTCAFKDLALQILPWLLTIASKKTDARQTKVILVATSGDTGKAALEGFTDVAGTKLIVFYPEDGVSAMQKLQMVTQRGENVFVCAIKGNFDDAQTGVKTIFADDAIKEKLAQNNMAFSSANSINWGRLAPQIVYYISSYCDLLNSGQIDRSGSFNVVVPTGNFGNILAAYYAREMGVPIKRLVCASNKNNILTDFINTGVYDRNRDFFTTASPSMDILISSNLERLLYHLTKGNAQTVKQLMASLSKDGVYKVDDEIKDKLSDIFFAGFCDDEATKKTIARTNDRFGYLCDTHTAVAVNVYGQFAEQTGDDGVTVIASTASPFKFASSVLEALAPAAVEGGEFEKAGILSRLTGIDPPEQLSGLKDKKIRFDKTCERHEMPDVVLDFLKL